MVINYEKLVTKIYDEAKPIQDIDIRKLDEVILNGLDDRDKMLLEKYYGYNLSCEQIGNEIGMTKQRVSTLLIGVMKRLKIFTHLFDKTLKKDIRHILIPTASLDKFDNEIILYKLLELNKIKTMKKLIKLHENSFDFFKLKNFSILEVSLIHKKFNDLKM